MKTPAIALILAVVAAPFCFAEQSPSSPDVAKPKRGVKVDPPLSANPPAQFSSLPVFGTIDWETRRLPWVDEGPYAGISGVAMVAHGGKVYVVGGFIPGGDGSDDTASRRTSLWTWEYDPKSDSWRQLADAPIRREYPRGIAVGDALYLIGGGLQYKRQDPPYRVHGECAMLDLSQNPPAWRMHGRLQVPRTHTSVGAIGNRLVVAGGNEYDFSERGYSHNTIRDTTEIFDLSKPQSGWQRRAPIPGAGRGWCGSLVAQGHLYLFGGLSWNEEGETVGTRETLRYDANRDRWQQMEPPPLAISGWEGALYDGRYALLAGGVVRPNSKKQGAALIWSDLVWAFDTQDDCWLRVAGKLPPGAVFNDPGVVVLGETMYVLGAEGPHGSHYNYFLVGRVQPK